MLNQLLQLVNIPGRAHQIPVKVTPQGKVDIFGYGTRFTPDEAEAYGLALIRAAAAAREVAKTWTPRRSPFPAHVRRAAASTARTRTHS